MKININNLENQHLQALSQEELEEVRGGVRLRADFRIGFGIRDVRDVIRGLGLEGGNVAVLGAHGTNNGGSINGNGILDLL